MVGCLWCVVPLNAHDITEDTGGVYKVIKSRTRTCWSAHTVVGEAWNVCSGKTFRKEVTWKT